MANGSGWALNSAAVLALTTLAACSGPAPHQTTPPPSAYREAPPPPLMGDSPPSADHSGLAGGPGGSAAPVLGPAPTSNPKYLMRLVTYRRADGVLVTAMRPVPNPEDLSADDRHAIYGSRYAPRAFLARGHGRGHVEMTAQAAPHAAQAPRAAAKPVAVAKLAPPPAAKPVVAVAAPPPKPAEVAKPVAAPKTEVAAMAAAPPGPTALKPPADPKLAKLQTAVGPEAAVGSKLAVPDNLAVGQTGQVSLSLPQTLLASLQREAAKLGLGKAAKKADVTATLSGEGYEITPNGPQTAQLKPGEAAAFNWQVKPGAGEKGPLKADVDATLKGLKLPMSFSLASLEQAVKAALPAPAPAAKTSWFDMLSIPGLKDVDVPAVGRVPSKSIVGGALVLLALLILVSFARGAAGRSAAEERRRKFRTMTDYGSKPVEDTFDFGRHDSHDLAAPIAAAGLGAAAGAAIATHEAHEQPAPHAAPAAEAHPAPHAAGDAHPAAEAAQAHGEGEPIVVKHGGHPAADAHAAVHVSSPVAADLAPPVRAALAANPGGPAVEDDYGLSQVIREREGAGEARPELTPG